MSVNNMPIVGELRDAVEILKLNKAKMAEIAGKKSATKWGWIILAVPAVVNLVLMVLRVPSGFLDFLGSYLMWTVLIPFLSYVAVIFVIDIVASKMFNAKSDFWGLFRVLAYASLVMWVSILPWLLGGSNLYNLFNLLTFVAGIWTLVVSYTMLMAHYKLSQQNAVIALVVSIVGYMIIQYILGSLLVGPGYRWMM
ncbi:MAG: Yip1 family protein [Candidatus Gracilibacteria bacterium]|jgi:hypothetical protein